MKNEQKELKDKLSEEANKKYFIVQQIWFQYLCAYKCENFGNANVFFLNRYLINVFYKLLTFILALADIFKIFYKLF